MLDTDMCSYIIRERPDSVLNHFNQLHIEQVCISIVSYAELLYGVERSQSKKINRPIIEDFTRHLSVIPCRTLCHPSHKVRDKRHTYWGNGYDDRRTCKEPKCRPRQQQSKALYEGKGLEARELGAGIGSRNRVTAFLFFMIVSSNLLNCLILVVFPQIRLAK